jgi:hypothetical protein
MSEKREGKEEGREKQKVRGYLPSPSPWQGYQVCSYII